MSSRRNIVPNVFTVLNFFCGFAAILKAASADYTAASWLIVLAAVFDVLDGRLARITKATSEFGIEFDSLADIISFGVAPGVMIHRACFYTMGVQGLIISFLPVLFGAIRLARFNIQLSDPEEKNAFTGLPIPATAVTLASYILFSYEFWDGVRYQNLLPVLVISLGVLMVSQIEYDPLPRFSLRESKRNQIKLLLVIAGSTVFFLFPRRAIFPLMMSYILFGFFRWIVALFRSNDDEDHLMADEHLGRDVT